MRWARTKVRENKFLSSVEYRIDFGKEGWVEAKYHPVSVKDTEIAAD